MNDRKRLEVIVDVMQFYLKPDGISAEDAISLILGLVDPLPEQPEQDSWVSLTDEEIQELERHHLFGGMEFDGESGYWAVTELSKPHLRRRTHEI